MKCTVKNISIDISFNQLAGLCTLCFLEQVSSDLNEYKLKALFLFPSRSEQFKFFLGTIFLEF